MLFEGTLMADLSFDLRQFLSGLQEANRRTLYAATKAVNDFGEQTLGNAQEYAPVETGALQASGTATPVQVSGAEINKEIGFNTTYAMARHERPPQEDAGVRQNPRGQWKFLERAMRENATKFAPFVAKRVDEAMG
jgi:hypothetical protein